VPASEMALRGILVTLVMPSLVWSNQRWAEEPTSSAVNPGEEAVLACKVVNMGGDCRWERRTKAGEAGMPVGIYRGKYEWAGRPGVGDCSLRILQADADYDAGWWVCQVTASSFRATDTLISKEARLVVRGPPKSVSLSVDGSPLAQGRLQGRAGEEAAVRCTAIGGNPAPTLMWRLGDAWVEAGPTTEDVQEGTVSSVLRLPLSRDHHGQGLQCLVRHPALTDDMAARAGLSVQFPPVTSFSPPEASPTVLEGGSYNVTCLVSANPPTQGSWVRGSTGEEAGIGPVLNLRSVSRHHGGAYNCIATNPLGSSDPRTLMLGVQYAASVVSVRPGGSLTGQYGGEVELHCEGAGSPSPNLSWQQTSARGVAGRGVGGRLTLSGLQYEDQGEYTCLAENSVGRERSPPVSLSVIGPPRVALAHIGGVQLLEGGDAVLEVEWCAAPFPRQVWLLEGRGGEELRLAAGLSHGKYRAAEAKPSDLSNCYISALHILQADAMDSREYKLRLENEHGAEEHIAQLTVGGLQWRKETVIGSLVGAASTLLVALLVLVCCCRRCCTQQKKVKQEAERTV